MIMGDSHTLITIHRGGSGERGAGRGTSLSESPPRSARKLSEREAKKRLDTDDRKCNNTFSPVSLMKKGLLGVEKGILPYSISTVS